MVPLTYPITLAARTHTRPPRWFSAGYSGLVRGLLDIKITTLALCGSGVAAINMLATSETDGLTYSTRFEVLVEKLTEEDSTITAVGDTSAADHVNVDDVYMAHINGGFGGTTDLYILKMSTINLLMTWETSRTKY
ncbi:hypothetical protein EVAR_80007_1 [Eumeta japonica]|uniref:Uncharacterized protein n=1 Tax=Eumeta variegata TaxID=151549 RepID=A0A4C1WLM2_EUMVA|nr:hypothetical protein EVAR_80007_1 [Eumeta japonica]